MKKYVFLLALLWPLALSAQTDSSLTVDQIMADPSWVGHSPSAPFWSPDGQRLYFFWNPDQSPSDSLYWIDSNAPHPQKVSTAQRPLVLAESNGTYNDNRDKLLFVQDHRLRLLDIRSDKVHTLLTTASVIDHPRFGRGDSIVYFQMDKNLYSYHLLSGRWVQLTRFIFDNPPEEKNAPSRQARLLKADALENAAVLRRRTVRAAAAKAVRQQEQRQTAIRPIYTHHQTVQNLQASPDGRFITYRLVRSPKTVKPTAVPDYITPSGYSEMIPSRPNVGVEQDSTTFCLYDRKADTVYTVATTSIPGIRDIPAFYKDYPKVYDSMKAHPPLRRVIINGPLWNKTGTQAVVVVRACDHKDRWIMLLQNDGSLHLLDRQHDSAWIGGPGIGYTYDMGALGWVDETHLWYQSEKTGYSHLYVQDVRSGRTSALTHGQHEIQDVQLSPDKQYFYLTTNAIAPGQTQFYRLSVQSNQLTQITRMPGGNQVTVSADGRRLAILHSTAIHPWELYIQANRPGAVARKVTDKAESAAYKKIHWQQPDILTFTNRDQQAVYASVYRPEQPAASHPGVLFIHGAGYLQDVQNAWSYYFREHMFINLLLQHGYTVMNIDYRGSAGYGRDWRTAIYRHMGENDLNDIVDGARYMVDSLGVNAEKIGLWGGSYGGFLTLMALFKTPVFACGAALRSVTDWAHYNHGYTSNILNLPQNDSLAYRRSSPIYFAEGLQGQLLMCHGIIDTNVHFQDIVRLTEKLIELKKTGWDLAVYPLESHDFKAPESWQDEYRRIFALFESQLN